MTDMLFDPFDLSGLLLPNRIVMPPMTRARAAAGQVPTDMMATYLYFSKGILLIGVEYLVFCIIVIFGFWRWRSEFRKYST